MFSFDRLDLLIKEKGVSGAYLCRTVGKTKSYITDMKRLGRIPSEDVISKWADALQTTSDYLCCNTDTKEKTPPDVSDEVFNDFNKLCDNDKSIVIDLIRRLSQANG